MAKKKKITRKELLSKPDEFITFSSKMLEFASAYQSQIFIGFIICLVLIGSVVGIRYYSNKAEKQTSDLLAVMMTKYEFIKSKSGPVVAYQAVEKESQLLLNELSNRKGGKLARVLYADMCYHAGEIDKAIELYTKALRHFSDTSAVRYFVLNGLGYCYEEKSDLKTAVKYFQMVVEGHDNALKGEALYHLGRIYAEIGDHEKSRAAFKKVLSDYGDSIYVDLIKERLAG
jgi:tetratricopeptide (TPR) repeat protein